MRGHIERHQDKPSPLAEKGAHSVEVGIFKGALDGVGEYDQGRFGGSAFFADDTERHSSRCNQLSGMQALLGASANGGAGKQNQYRLESMQPLVDHHLAHLAALVWPVELHSV